jgi:ribose transport system permease protein
MNARSMYLAGLNWAPLIVFGLALAVLGSLSDRFLQPQNLLNIVVQSSALAIAAIGIMPVLLIAGVDLSIGSLMFVAVAVAGKMIASGQPIWLGFAAGLAVGAAGGAINAVFVTRLRVIPFVATLGMLFVARGFGLWLTNTRAMNMPDAVTQLGAMRLVGIPVPVLCLIAVAASVHWFLASTAWGRQVYAIGSDAQAAAKAGVRVSALRFGVYVLCGVCAALAGIVALTQTGAVSPSFGQGKEFAAIAAAVLGGTSLFGGRGGVLGTLFGAVLFQTVENALGILNADPYLYPIVLSAIIFLAVLLDTLRARLLRSVARRRIGP